MNDKLKIEEVVQLRTCCVGFDGACLNAIRSRFNVQYVIAESADSDLNWHDLHNHRINHCAPVPTTSMMACLEDLWGQYLQFIDINSRRHYYVSGREAEIYNGFMITFYAVYQILTEQQIELVLHANIPHEGFDFVLHKVACHLKIPSVLSYQSLIPNRFWISASMKDFGCHSQMPVIFKPESSHYQLPESWFYMRGSEHDAAYGLSKLLAEVARSPQRIPAALIRYFYAQQYRRDVKKNTSDRGAGEPYIYFPLHLQPELTTAAVGGIYADQMLALEALSAEMPDGHYIYVKENPKQTEKQRGPLFYKRFAALKNVRMISVRESSADLIRCSVGVATITGTAGWEALFHGKPVLVFGAAWYREFPGVTTFSNAFDYACFLEAKPPAPHVLVAKLDQALTTAGRGVVDPAYSELISDFDELKNAQEVAISLSRHVFSRLGFVARDLA